MAGTLCPSLAQAQAPSENSWHVDRLRNNAWPQPFRSMDAASAWAPFEIMKQNGWREFNTIGHGFFDERGRLTEAGNLKVHQSLTTSPPNRRSIFVLQGSNDQETAARVESVQVAVSGYIPTGPLPEIAVTNVEPAASSGQYQTTINRALARTTPAPRLPKMTSLNAPAQAAPMVPGAGQTGGR